MATRKSKRIASRSQTPLPTYTISNELKINAPELEGKFKIIEKIGHGGYANVYKAIDLQSPSHKIVAIKRVQSANIKANYAHHPCIEVKILSEFRCHHYFPTLHCVLCDKSSGSYSIVMDYFEHQSFCEYNSILSESETIKYIYVLLSCINALSQKGYIHRDIKPGNFLYNHDKEKYLLIDFGLCHLDTAISAKYDEEIKIINAHQKHRKKKNKPQRKRKRRSVYSGHVQLKPVTSQVIRDGTPGFRAPEVILASNYQDSRIDVFNVGIILGCIMLGINVMFNPNNDYQQLLQFVSIYGWRKVVDTSQGLHRNIQIRGLNREAIFMNNGVDCLNSQTWVSGYEHVVCGKKANLSYWIKQRMQCLNNNNNNNCRKWSQDLYDLLDKLTQFNPFKRVTPKQALQHKLFHHYSL